MKRKSILRDILIQSGISIPQLASETQVSQAIIADACKDNLLDDWILNKITSGINSLGTKQYSVLELFPSYHEYNIRNLEIQQLKIETDFLSKENKELNHIKGRLIDEVRALIRAASKSTQNNSNEFYFSSILQVPSNLRTALQQYILFFKRYIWVTKAIDICFEVRVIDEGLKIEFSPTQKANTQLICRWFNEYIELMKVNIDQLNINYDISKPDSQKKEFESELLIQIKYLRESLKLLHFKQNNLPDEISASLLKGNLLVDLSSTKTPNQEKVAFLMNQVAGNNYPTVFEELKILLIDNSDLLKELILIQQRFDLIKSQKRKGLTEIDSTIRSLSKIGDDLLDLIGMLNL